MNDSSIFYSSLGFTGFVFVVLLSHLLTTYGNLRLGAGVILFAILAAIAIITLVAIMYASYSNKSFSKTAVQAGGSIGLLLLFVVVVALIIGGLI